MRLEEFLGSITSHDSVAQFADRLNAAGNLIAGLQITRGAHQIWALVGAPAKLRVGRPCGTSGCTEITHPGCKVKNVEKK